MYAHKYSSLKLFYNTPFEFESAVTITSPTSVAGLNTMGGLLLVRLRLLPAVLLFVLLLLLVLLL